jgi:hypothetical protein
MNEQERSTRIEKAESILETLNEISGRGDYRELIIAMVMFDRGIDYEDAEIDYFTWYESHSASFLQDILSGEADGSERW